MRPRKEQSASNAHGRTHYTELEPCPWCGRLGGERHELGPERTCIRCAACGYTVEGKGHFAMATRAWNRESRAGKKEDKT